MNIIKNIFRIIKKLLKILVIEFIGQTSPTTRPDGDKTKFSKV